MIYERKAKKKFHFIFDWNNVKAHNNNAGKIDKWNAFPEEDS